MPEKLKNFIRNLSEIYDEDSKDTYISVYLNKNVNNKFIKRRIKTCETVLQGEELKNFTKSMIDINKILEKNKGKNIAVFASHKHNFIKYKNLDVKTKNQIIVDSSPYLRPLARIIDEWESFTLLLVNSNYAKIFSVSMGQIENTKKLSADIMNKHKKGGFSQARFNRLRKGAIQEFLSEVIEALQQRADKRIIIAGPGQAKIQLKNMLPKDLNDHVVETIDININNEEELLKKSINLISEKEEIKSHEAVQHLKQEILKDGLAVYGIEDTLKAVKNGQVELLLIQKNFKLQGWICEKCQIVKEGTQSTCSYCGKKTSKVDILEEILEFAERTDASIEFIDDKEISELGHVGAILRYK